MRRSKDALQNKLKNRTNTKIISLGCSSTSVKLLKVVDINHFCVFRRNPQKGMLTTDLPIGKG